MIIRDGEKKDIPVIFKFIRDLAIYENAEHEVLASEKDIEKTLFNKEIPTKSLICEIDGTPIGFAVYFYNYSTWLGKHGIYLEDLYIDPKFRGMGYGKKLIKKVAKIAVNNGCDRFQWSCLDWNKPSLDFYNSIGAEQLNEWIALRLSGDKLKEFAES